MFRRRVERRGWWKQSRHEAYEIFSSVLSVLSEVLTMLATGERSDIVKSEVGVRLERRGAGDCLTNNGEDISCVGRLCECEGNEVGNQIKLKLINKFPKWRISSYWTTHNEHHHTITG